MPLNSADSQFKASWPANTTPQAPDGSGTSRRTLCGVGLTNPTAAAVFVKLYDTNGAPTVGTTVPKRTIEVGIGLSFYADFQRGKDFLQGLWVSVTGAAADTDTTAPAAGVLVTIDFQ